MSLIKQILGYRKNGRKLLFTTPTHSQNDFIECVSKKFLGSKIFNCDYSEIEGFDNLRDPKGILKKVLERLTRIYRSKATFILTNGSTSGIEAAMLALLKENDKVIIARNCHVCVYNGLVLTGAKPVWVLPSYNKDWGIFESLTKESLERVINENLDAKAVILTSPTYEGIFSDIKELSELTKKAQMKLIVDEAHGALLNFGNFKAKPAILSGADISVQSLHKTAGTLTPAALLHIGENSSFSSEDIQESLNLLNTTSPSYPIMLSVEATVNYLNSDKGKTNIRDLQKNIKKMSALLQKKEDLKIYDGYNDNTKILFKYEGVFASDVTDILNNKLMIEEEFSNTKSLLFITGLGTTKWKLYKLFSALSRLKFEKADKEITDIYADFELPQQVMTPKEAFYKSKRLYVISDTVEKIAAEPVLSYPPGIPILVPGERISENILNFVSRNVIKVCE